MVEKFSNEYCNIVEKAKRIAKELHLGQKDKAGVDYFMGHLTQVANEGCCWEDKVVGYLHDVAEDTEHTVEFVMKYLTSNNIDNLPLQKINEIEEALKLLNSKNSSTREDYIACLCKSQIALRVKCNDLKHNMDISRIPHPTKTDFDRTDNYKREYEILLNHLH